jgi:hypothetical protein
VPLLILGISLGCAGGGSTPVNESPGDDSAGPDGGALDAAKAVYCQLSPPTSCPDPPLRYGDVEGIFRSRCTTPCHDDALGGPWPLTQWDDISDWRDAVRADLLDCTMPPPDAGVPMLLDERLAILGWIRCGLPR